MQNFSKPLRVPHGKEEQESSSSPFVMLFDLKKSLKKDRCKNDEELKKDLHGALFMQHYLIKKQLILDFDVNILERQCFPLN